MKMVGNALSNPHQFPDVKVWSGLVFFAFFGHNRTATGLSTSPKSLDRNRTPINQLHGVACTSHDQFWITNA